MKTLSLLFGLFLSVGLTAQPTLTNNGGGTTFGSTGTTTTTTRDKTQGGFGARFRAALARRDGLSTATTAARDNPPPVHPAPDNTSATDLEGAAVYYLENDDLASSREYTDAARSNLQRGNLEDGLTVFQLYAAIAEETAAAGNEKEAEELLNQGESAVLEQLEAAREIMLETYEEMGWAYYELGNFEKSGTYFYEAYSQAPQGADALYAYLVASTMSLSGDTDSALDFLEYALEGGLLSEGGGIDLADDSDLDNIRNTERYAALAEAYGF